MKKALKRSLSFFLAITIIFSSAYVGLNELDFSGLFAIRTHAASISDLSFELSFDGTSYSVVGCDEYASGELAIPATHNGLPVTTIEDDAFSSCTSLVSITIPDSVTRISDRFVFSYCLNLKAIHVDENNSNYLSIDGVLFQKHKTVLLRNKTTLIKYPAKKLDTEYIVPDNVITIADEAFEYCENLVSITIPDTVTEIGSSTFRDCVNLSTVSFGKGITIMGEGPFYGCINLKSVYITDLAAWCNIDHWSMMGTGSPLSYGADLYINGVLATDIVIPDTVTVVRDEVFAGCASITSVEIPNSVSKIGNCAFGNCQNLKSVTIPSSVTEIDSGAFGCPNLESVYITDVEAWCNIPFEYSHSNPLEFADKLYINGQLAKDIVIPDGVTKIPRFGFSCASIETVSIPNSVTNIGYGAFYKSVNLKSITIPSNVITIERETFCGCTSLASITIPNSITSIERFAFEECTNLQSVWISDIGAWCNISFGNRASNPLSYDGVLYINGELPTNVDIPSDVTKIPDFTFRYNTELKSVTMPEGVTSIGDYAFKRCTRLETITIPGSVSSIGYDVFDGCTGLDSVYISDVGAWCNISFGNKYSVPLQYANKLYINGELATDIAIPDGVESIPEYGFSCTNITSVTIPDSVTKIGDWAFYDCKSLKSINVEENNPNYFSEYGILFNKNKTSLIKYPAGDSSTAYVIPNGVTSIGIDAFQGCLNLKSIQFPESITSIGEYAFSECSNLESVYVNNITAWCNIDFKYYYSNPLFYTPDFYIKEELATDVVIPDGVKKIPQYGFSCLSLKTITIPKSVTKISECAFANAMHLETVYYYGSKEQWNNITIESNNEYLRSAKKVYNYSEDAENSGTFRVSDGKNYKTFNYDYKDSFFDKKATTYNHELATMSLSLALSSYQSEKLGVTYFHAEKLLKDCGYNNFKPYNYEYETTADDVGCLISQKQIGEKTMIAVVVRSGGYDKEWASNLTVGYTGDHQGFDEASDIVLSRIKSYIKEQEISGDVKFWITGYSRGAATATQTAAKLNYTKINGVNFTKNEIYAYGFATPAGAIKGSDPTNTEKYGNIFNIVNFHDIVPKVAPEGWGFTRYGKTFYLPFSDTSGTCHIKEQPVREWFKKNKIPYEIDNYISYHIESGDGKILGIANDSLGVFSTKLVSSLTNSIGTRRSYVSRLQTTIRYIWANEVGLSMGIVLHKIIDTLNKELVLSPTYVVNAIANAELLAEAHDNCGAYYLGWMQTMPKNLTEKEYKKQGYFSTGSLRKLIANCPVDVYVYDVDGNLVAAIENEKPVEIEGSTFSYGVDENGQKYVYLPVDTEYNITVKAREDCETTCTINEFSVDSVSESRVLTYTEIQMEEGEEISAFTESYSESDIVNGTENGSSADYIVQRENEEVIEADVDASGEEIEDYTYNVTVEYDENKGTVYGGGSFTIGQFCQVTAENKPGYRFSKWTVNGETVSTEATYRFAVKEDVTIVAEYVPCKHPDSAISDWILVADATVHAPGSKHKECTICGEIMETVVFPQLKPGTPKLSKVSRTASGVKFEWQEVEGADEFYIYRKTKGGKWSRVGTLKADEDGYIANSFTDTKAKTGTTYYYTVKAQNEAGASGYNKTGLKIKYVAAPKLTKIANESSGVRVYWGKVSGADGYYLYRRVAGSKTWTKVATIKKGSTTSYLDKKASAGKTYEYIIKCYDGSTPSAAAAKVIKIKRLTVPKLVSAKSSKTGITVKWGKVAGAEGYLVYRKTGKGSWVQLTKVEGNAKVSFVDKSAKKGKTYTYTVRAYSGSYKSSYNSKGLTVKDKY